MNKVLFGNKLASERVACADHSLTDDTDEQKEQISFLYTQTLRDLKVGELTEL